MEVNNSSSWLNPSEGFNPICSLDHCGRQKGTDMCLSHLSFNPICSLDHCGSFRQCSGRICRATFQSYLFVGSLWKANRSRRSKPYINVSILFVRWIIVEADNVP